MIEVLYDLLLQQGIDTMVLSNRLFDAVTIDGPMSCYKDEPPISSSAKKSNSTSLLPSLEPNDVCAELLEKSYLCQSTEGSTMASARSAANPLQAFCPTHDESSNNPPQGEVDPNPNADGLMVEPPMMPHDESNVDSEGEEGDTTPNEESNGDTQEVEIHSAASDSTASTEEEEQPAADTVDSVEEEDITLDVPVSSSVKGPNMMGLHPVWIFCLLGHLW